MATAGEISVGINATTGQLTAQLEVAEQQFRTFARNTAGILDTLKGTFGRGSGLAQWGKIFAGGGAIVGLKLLSNELLGLSEKVRTFADLTKAGAGWREMTLEFAQSIPIFGTVTKTFENIFAVMNGGKLPIEGIKTAREAAASLEEVYTNLGKAPAMGDPLAKLRREHDDAIAKVEELAAKIEEGSGSLSIDEYANYAGSIRMINQAWDEAMRAPLVEYLTKLEDSRREATMGAEQWERYKLSMMGATIEQIEHARAVEQTITAAREARKANEDIAGFIDKMQTPLGQSAEATQIDKWEQQGADPEAVKSAREALAAHEKATAELEAQKKLAGDIARTQDQMRSPFEKYTARLEELQRQLAGGLDMTSFGRAADAALAELQRSLAAEGPKPGQLAGAALRGSTEAYSIIAQAGKSDYSRDTANNTKQLVELAKQNLGNVKDQARRDAEAQSRNNAVGGF